MNHLLLRAADLARLPLDSYLLGLPVTFWLWCVYSEMGE